MSLNYSIAANWSSQQEHYTRGVPERKNELQSARECGEVCAEGLENHDRIWRALSISRAIWVFRAAMFANFRSAR
ncbi:MAG: hypothetical protein U9O54_05100, partial [Chloroflexota bacterium]|nr:hypothetical protein [Chloroflexota bacterium]